MIERCKLDEYYIAKFSPNQNYVSNIVVCIIYSIKVQSTPKFVGVVFSSNYNLYIFEKYVNDKLLYIEYLVKFKMHMMLKLDR